MMLRSVITLVACWCLMVTSASQADVVIGSWNIKHLGWNNDKRMDKAAHVSAHFDLLAIQELMNEDALRDLQQELESLTGEHWNAMASHALGRSTYREHYAFVWRDSSIEYVDGAVVFLDHQDVFSREPYSARFQSKRSGQQFVLANIHVVYGQRVSDRLPEIDALADYWQWLGEVYPGTPRLLAGDFNLAPSHPGWERLRQQGVIASIKQGATTLGMADGRYANLYDNIWKIPGHLAVNERGIIRFPDLLDIDHITARDRVSDHAPVYVALGSASVALRPFTTSASQRIAANTPVCVDLNTSPASQLETLPHIGAARAQAIIDGRPWRSTGDLTAISGLGAARVGDIANSQLLCLQ